MEPECDDGSVEYKRHLVKPSQRTFDKLTAAPVAIKRGKRRVFVTEIGADDDGTVRGINEEEMKLSIER